MFEKCFKFALKRVFLFKTPMSVPEPVGDEACWRHVGSFVAVVILVVSSRPKRISYIDHVVEH